MNIYIYIYINVYIPLSLSLSVVTRVAPHSLGRPGKWEYLNI